MQRLDAIKALEIYRRACQQAERLSEFYEICKNRDLVRVERFIKVEQPPASFLQTMEEYVREAPRMSTARKDLAIDNKLAPPKEVLAIEYTKEHEVREEPAPSPPPPEPVKEEAPAVAPPDLLSLDDPVPAASELDDKNALALAVVPVADQPTTFQGQANGTTGWELALVTAPSSNDNAMAASKLAGGLDKLTLDSLYEDAIRRNSQPASYNPWEPVPMPGPMMQTTAHDPFFASGGVATPHSVQMAAMANQQQAFMLQQQQYMMMMGPQQQPMNPFGSPFGANVHPYGSGMPPVQAYNPHPGFI
uniref:Uncharacterized protein MANES_06G046400 n=1 Tax=Rhizophora mucronata TaxID=61149 RepID=A0A2P2LP58_RHIMU